MNYGEFIARTGALAMGATTYEWILDHEFSGKDPSDWEWPYEIPCWVFTHRQLPVVPGAQIAFTSGDVVGVHEAMGARPAIATSGSWAAVTSPASSPTRDSWTRSSCRSRR